MKLRPLEAAQAANQVVALMQAAACQCQCQCQCQEQHIDLFVLREELCPVGYSEDTFANYLPSNQTAQAMYHEIDEKLQQALVHPYTRIFAMKLLDGSQSHMPKMKMMVAVSGSSSSSTLFVKSLWIRLVTK